MSRNVFSVALTTALTTAVLASGLAVRTPAALAAAPRPAHRPAAEQVPAPSGDARVRELLTRLTTTDGVPGALIETRDRRGRTVLTSGVADIRTGAPVRGDSRFRIGSMTKPFIATVLLQLVGERRVVLDAPVERYLPGVVRGSGNDGRKITVRQLLQHTSGVPDYVRFLDPEDVFAHPLTHHDARDLVKLALAHPPTFRPGEGWSYSNTGYLLVGMIIERVTGHSYGTEVERRVLRPLGLRDTSVPGDRTEIGGTHPRGYVQPDGGAPLLDLTSLNPSIAGAAGEMVSSARDVDRFLGALLRGRLLRPAELRQMMTTRPTGRPDGRAYGLGLESRPLPCGGLYWGHGGDIFGFQTMDGATSGGRQATIMANLDPGGSDAQPADMRTAVEGALCDAHPSASR